MNILIRILDSKDAEIFQELRLRGLKTMPEAFGSSFEEEVDLPISEIHRRLDTRPNAVFGAFSGQELVGVAGFAGNPKTKQRHKGLLWGVYVDEQWRGHQLGKRLTQAVIDYAREHVDTLHATVMAANISARTLYLGLGFTVFGVEKDALRINGQSYTDELLRLDFR
ncbi:GNAT family N-acetyltransferase [Phyllobacterium sp. YR531]|uniref:GNAT family N-acetyltransferase n=1 Tax=Phyllobacterium sp. YR531 TaxID=1144343 RepID=UPI00026FA13B|nr:GNAT family N-acetyltransferase [Phyllobacterium sp. YR531]EJN04124.1 acetyltransferase, ribosomal protein N-acetylase [Phyllobacterium sp. YR531]